MSSVSIPDDVLMEILAYLPGKSLSRFKCVCKGWILLIENPDFIAKHHQTQVACNNNGCALIKRGLTGSRSGIFSLICSKDSFISCEDLVLPSTVDTESMGFVRLIGPCKSLFCATNEWSSDITIWNPATNEFKLLPSSPIPDSPQDVFSRWASIGFGSDSLTNSYKVVRIWNVILHGLIHDIDKVEVWNSGDNSWRQIDAVPPVLIARYSEDHVYKDGKFYWRGLSEDPFLDEYPGEAEEFIVSFDMNSEVFKGIAVPDYRNVNVGVAFWGEMLELNGSICLCTHPKEISQRRFEIWMMNGSGDDITWSKYMTVEIPVGVPWRPYGFWKNGEMLLGDGEMLIGDREGPLISYDPVTKGITDLKVFVSPKHQVVLYNESIAPIK